MTTLFAMGGAVGVAGNSAAAGEGIDTATAAWHVRVDPRAANIVLLSGFPAVLAWLASSRSRYASRRSLGVLPSKRRISLPDRVCGRQKANGGKRDE